MIYPYDIHWCIEQEKEFFLSFSRIYLINRIFLKEKYHHFKKHNDRQTESEINFKCEKCFKLVIFIYILTYIELK
jgi:hypothetical protein